ILLGTVIEQPWAQGGLSDSIPRNSRWNVLLVSIDTLRADHLGCFGYKAGTSPSIDQLASQSVLFERAFTPVPLTLPAHTSLLTGMYPSKDGVHDNGDVLGSTIPTIAENFRENGYATGAFIGSFDLDRRFGLNRGFDEYWGSFDLHQHQGEDPGSIQIRGDRVAAAAEKWIADVKGRPFFSFVHFYDLHGPYLAPQTWRNHFPSSTYDAEIGFVDDLIAHLCAALKADGVWDRTLIAIVADHGEGLGDHGERNHG